MWWHSAAFSFCQKFILVGWLGPLKSSLLDIKRLFLHETHTNVFSVYFWKNQIPGLNVSMFRTKNYLLRTICFENIDIGWIFKWIHNKIASLQTPLSLSSNLERKQSGVGMDKKLVSVSRCWYSHQLFQLLVSMSTLAFGVHIFKVSWYF